MNDETKQESVTPSQLLMRLASEVNKAGLSADAGRIAALASELAGEKPGEPEAAVSNETPETGATDHAANAEFGVRSVAFACFNRSVALYSVGDKEGARVSWSCGLEIGAAADAARVGLGA